LTRAGGCGAACWLPPGSPPSAGQFIGAAAHTFTIGPAQARDQSANYCGVLWVSANGAGLLTQCGNIQQEVVTDRAVRTKLAVTVLAPPAGWADSFA